MLCFSVTWGRVLPTWSVPRGQTVLLVYSVLRLLHRSMPSLYVVGLPAGSNAIVLFVLHRSMLSHSHHSMMGLVSAWGFP